MAAALQGAERGLASGSCKGMQPGGVLSSVLGCIYLSTAGSKAHPCRYAERSLMASWRTTRVSGAPEPCPAVPQCPPGKGGQRSLWVPTLVGA